MVGAGNLAVLRGNWGNCVTTFLVVSTARMAGTRNLAVFLKKRAEQRMQVEEEVRKKTKKFKEISVNGDRIAERVIE